MRQINLQEVLKNNPLDWVVDEQHRLNHETCPAGRDTRERLYVKAVNPNGSFVAHCFNCGGSGSFFSRGTYRTLTDILQDGRTEYTENKGGAAGALLWLRDVHPITDIRLKAWLYKYGVFEEDFRRIPVHQDRPGDILIFPLGPQSCQLRDFSGHFKGKYISFLDEKHPNHGLYLKYGHTLSAFEMLNKHPSLVLTEDIVSAYRCNRDLDVTVEACLGTNVEKALQYGMNRSIEDIHFYIWFDGDTTGRKKALEAHSKIASVIKGKVHLVLADKSPKEYPTAEELQEAFRVGTEHLK